MFVAFFAAYLAVAPLDAPHAALLTVLTEGPDAGGCDAAHARKAAAAAPIRRLGRVGSDEVVLAEVFDPCICGAQNCPLYVLRLAPGKPRVLLTAFAIGIKLKRAAPLPTLVVRSHDSAMISDETTYAYRDGGYAVIDDARIRGDTEARKPNGIPVRFAAGASSANLHGSVSIGWYDEYLFDASKGQKLIVDGVRSGAKVTLTLIAPPSGAFAEVRAGVPFTLPTAGSYRLRVDGMGETDVPYTLTLAIR